MFWLLVRGIYLSFQGIIQTSSGKEKSTLIISTYENWFASTFYPIQT
jgi:hypothetical protein